jgi:hypothetical protein
LAVVHSQKVDANRRGGGLAYNATVSNIERGAVQGTDQAICSHSSSLELRHRVRAFVFDSEEFALGMADQNVVAEQLKGLVAAIRDIADISQISKIAAIQAFFPADGLERVS